MQGYVQKFVTGGEICQMVLTICRGCISPTGYKLDCGRHLVTFFTILFQDQIELRWLPESGV